MKPIGTYLPSGLPAATATATAPAAPAAAPPPPPPIGPNPRMRLDPALGIVVTEFLDASGKPARSVPSASQIEAYRNAQRGLT
ncbi:hypothetical protein [Sediminicoccus sp. BL-A-41-H5]|uniref:hypothetical protein n=1 Tax=Sediminicoccus sp. BL-A-41-H5 TaxID=3421106 RepID=UPI003D67CBF3